MMTTQNMMNDMELDQVIGGGGLFHSAKDGTGEKNNDMLSDIIDGVCTAGKAISNAACAAGEAISEGASIVWEILKFNLF